MAALQSHRDSLSPDSAAEEMASASAKLRSGSGSGGARRDSRPHLSPDGEGGEGGSPRGGRMRRQSSTTEDNHKWVKKYRRRSGKLIYYSPSAQHYCNNNKESTREQSFSSSYNEIRFLSASIFVGAWDAALLVYERQELAACTTHLRIYIDKTWTSSTFIAKEWMFDHHSNLGFPIWFYFLGCAAAAARVCTSINFIYRRHEREFPYYSSKWAYKEERGEQTSIISAAVEI